MRVRSIVRKGLAAVLAVSLLVPSWPAGGVQVAKADEEFNDTVARIGKSVVGNASDPDSATNLLFNYGEPGFENAIVETYQKWKHPDNNPAQGNLRIGQEDQPEEELNGELRYEIRIAQHKDLKAVAEGGDAKVIVGFDKLYYYEGGFGPWGWERYSSIEFKVDGQRVLYDIANNGDKDGYESSPVSIKTNSVIEIIVRGGRRVPEKDEPGTGASGVSVKIIDTTRPVIEAYTFIGDGATQLNEKNEQELFVKEKEYISLSYHFSEPVKPSGIASQTFLEHPLFVNPDGTGLPAAGEQQYFKNMTFTNSGPNEFQDTVTFKYEGKKFHHSGNLPLKPKLAGTEPDALEEIFKNANLVDAAGNEAIIRFANLPATNESNPHLHGKKIDPFDFENGGYRVIVDAVAPKYTKVGNGIQPEILTGVTLNKGDSIDFTVQLTEPAIIRRGWDVKQTFLHFNNGMKAYYVSGSGTDKWTFHMDIPEDQSVEVPLLKAIALSHESKGDDSDKEVLQDYAGNFLIQPANFEGIHKDCNILNPDECEESNVNSKIDWANLAIDNTQPSIRFNYEAGGANDTTYRKTGRMTIDANDPQIAVPPLDPTEAGQLRPSRGIYRPSNMSGAPSVGLVYYYWSQSPDNPFSGKDEDHFAAIKRYSLAAKQPGDGLYPGELDHVKLQVVNNKTNMIAPPAEALTPENSGEWYLHAWTADMTWDSARELMQYEKMANFIANNPEQYEAWKNELQGASEADKIIYANNKALDAVGQYGDENIWPLDDFKQDDSNWVYDVGVIKLDNRVPDIQLSSITGNRTSAVQIKADIRDEHSGLAEVQYKLVPVGTNPDDVLWLAADLDGSTLTVSTLDHVFEDGDYYLYISAVDQAGNGTVSNLDTVVTVNSEDAVSGRFTPEANPNYVQSHDVVFHLKGFGFEQTVTSFVYSATVTSDTYLFSTMGGDPDDGMPLVSYAVTGTATRPSSDNDYIDISDQGTPGENGELDYTIPIRPDESGTRYVHVKVLAPDLKRTYYFSKAYYFDNEPPSVAFSLNSTAYPKESHRVTVTVTEIYSEDGLTKHFLWRAADDNAPDALDAGWTPLPEDGSAELDNSVLSPGEVKDFKLYVKAVDGAGNITITGTTGIFKLSRPDVQLPPARVDSSVIYMFGTVQDGYTAILKLDLDTPDKRGYEYSVSHDNGASWTRWRPYTNFTSLEVPSIDLSTLQFLVKFRTPGGVIGEAARLDTSNISVVEPVYGLAAYSTTRPVSPDTGVQISITTPAGIRVVPAEANPSVPERNGNTFTVRENGVYSFDLSDIADPSRKEVLYAVVNNVDGTPPIGEIEYLTTGPTNGSVTVRLHTSEPVRVINHNSQNYTFTNNGTFTFEFADEAGNIGTAQAVVNNIDKNGPRVKVVRSYAYGESGSKTFGTITDDNGNVILSSGVTLELQKEDGETKTFTVVSGSNPVIVTRNGTVSFTAADEYGNLTTVYEEVSGIFSEPPAVDEIVYEFVDDDGNPLPEDRIVTINGEKYARGKMKVTLRGKTEAPNKVFAGMAPIEENGEYTNLISGEDGSFEYSRVYSSDGSTFIGISDLLNNVNRVPITVKGLDNKAPEITLNLTWAGVEQNKADFDFRKDLGGFIVTDNVSSPENITVTISGLDLSKIGRQRVTYTAVDEAGNTAIAYQDVVVASADGMLIFGNDVLISAASGETAIFSTNTITFNIDRYNRMNVEGEERLNEWGTYDLLYQPGLYREGQMKYIAEKITWQELVSGQFTVTFPQAGWYTVIVRNQEREREFAAFFIGNMAQ